MKKLTALLLAVLMVAMAFAGCAKSNSVNITKAEDLNGLKIGVQAGTTGQYYAEDDLTDVKVSAFKSGMDAALDLKSGQLDAVILDELPAKAIVAQNKDLKILSNVELTSEEYAIAVKKGNTDLLNKINAAIKKMKDDGTYKALSEAYITADGTVNLPDAIVSDGPVLKMGTNAAFPPFEYVEGTEIVGFDVSMAQYVAKELGMKLEIVNMEFDSLLSALSSGAIDFVAAGMTVREDRLEYADFTDTYYSTTQVVIVKK